MNSWYSTTVHSTNYEKFPLCNRYFRNEDSVLMKSLYLAIIASLFAFTSYSQHPCAQHIIEQQLRSSDPDLEQSFQAFKKDVFANQTPSGSRAEVYVIPVVFHIIHNNGPENIPDAQIHDAMRILNEDYSAVNAELATLVSAFNDDIGLGDLEFRLAKLDPDGNSTTGIERIESPETYVGDDGSKLDPWPRDEYLNIWVTDVIYIGGAAAYAYRPPSADGNPDADGVISNHRYVGSIGTASGTTGKTLTHEVGHYLGLPHTWGETNAPGCDGSQQGLPCDGANNCQMDDGINDTPNCLGVIASNCDLNRTTCGSLDNIQNFMDYASCEANFTKGQITVMRNVLNSSVAERKNLWKQSNLGNTGVADLTTAHFHIQKRAFCAGDTVKFFDESTYGAETWSWNITGPETITSTDRHPKLSFTMAGKYNVELTVTQGATTLSVSEELAFAVSEPIGLGVPFVEDFSEDGNWITDNYLEEDDGDVWEYNTEFGSGDNTCYKLSNIGAKRNSIDDLIFSSLDFRPLDKITISFDVAYARIAGDNSDALTLLVSDDCGDSWRNLWTRNGNSLSGSTPITTVIFEPQASDWENFSIPNLPVQWFTSNTMIKFQSKNDGGNHMYLDNINISGTYYDEPFLAYPGNGAPSMNNNVLLNWQSVPGSSSYNYEIDTDANFTSGALQSGLTTYIDESSNNEDTEFATSGLENGSTYYWRVNSLKHGNTSAWSEVWSFTVAANGVAIQDNEALESFNIYPNPAENLLNIRFKDEMNVEGIRLLTIDGKTIMEQLNGIGVVKQWSWDIQSIPTGVYFLCVDSDHGSRYKQFIISK